MVRIVLIVTSAVVLLAVGVMTAAAGNRHAQSGGQEGGATNAGAITALTTGAVSEAKARADAQAEVVQPQTGQQGTDEEQDDDGGEGSD